MKVIFTLFVSLALFSELPAQKITGIWRGYFSSSTGIYKEGLREEMYKYEIQLNQLSNNGIKGITFSYKTTVFYGKATLQGIYNEKSKTLLIKETNLVDLKVGDKTEPCLMTCYLDYSKVGKLEVFQGSFISTNIKDKGDCGSGTVYLEKVPVSDFAKEDFLKAQPKDSTPTKSNPTSLTQTPLKKSIPVTPSNKNTNPVGSPSKKMETTPKEIPLKRNEEAIETNTMPSADATVPEKRNLPVPKVLKERENNLVKTIITDEASIQIDLFDNGTIDNDTISVYHNNVLMVKSGRLSLSPISFKIKNNAIDNLHELVIVAENLGEIPPNIALMVITAGKKRYEVFLASNEEKNAKVVIQYLPKQ
jgi:hypothetical protein